MTAKIVAHHVHLVDNHSDSSFKSIMSKDPAEMGSVCQWKENTIAHSRIDLKKDHCGGENWSMKMQGTAQATEDNFKSFW